MNLGTSKNHQLLLETRIEGPMKWQNKIQALLTPTTISVKMGERGSEISTIESSPMNKTCP